ncbi:hypothetical protein [Candidatus Burkholderia verschuerenii]|uniref:hypothetical protein n=1 Tax=Candidatus Burkholderia verschuerenii TaxID=242163 RepID=UPI000A5B1B48|nr:hypothetical protein [Candidatus Burkholderia verschuerenii]
MGRSEHHCIFCLPREDAPALVVAIVHERMDLMARLADRLKEYSLRRCLFAPTAGFCPPLFPLAPTCFSCRSVGEQRPFRLKVRIQLRCLGFEACAVNTVACRQKRTASR